MKKLTTKLSRFARKSNVLLIKGKIILETPSRIIVDCSEDFDPDVFDAKTRRLISDSIGEYAKQGYWRMSAGGGLRSIRQNGETHVILTERDSEAPSFPYHLNGESGVSSSIMEIFDPFQLILKEMTEEVAILINGGLLQMNLSSIYDPLILQTYTVQKKILKGIVGLDLPTIIKPIRRKAKIVPCSQDIDLETIFENTRVHVRGLLIKDPETRGLDIYKNCEIQLEPQDRFSLVHCETFKGAPLNNRVFLINPKEVDFRIKKDGTGTVSGVTRAFQSGRELTINPKQVFPLTPVATKSFQAFYRS